MLQVAGLEITCSPFFVSHLAHPVTNTSVADRPRSAASAAAELSPQHARDSRAHTVSLLWIAVGAHEQRAKAAPTPPCGSRAGVLHSKRQGDCSADLSLRSIGAQTNVLLRQ